MRKVLIAMLAFVGVLVAVPLLAVMAAIDWLEGVRDGEGDGNCSEKLNS